MEAHELVWQSMRDSWDSDDFENQIASSIIGLLEPVGRWPVENYCHELTQHDANLIKRAGLFVPHPSRIALKREIDQPLRDTYKGVMCMALDTKECGSDHPWLKGSYQQFTAIRREPALPRGYLRPAPGELYSTIMMIAFNNRLSGMKMYFTAQGRKIMPCQRRGFPEDSDDCLTETCTLANFVVDSRHTWTISAADSSIRVNLGCYHDEVKSLLYARSLPMTASGRKRPVLHLVAAHRRRMKEGIDLDISQFLRGVRKVEMGGAVFDVSAPAVEVEKMAVQKTLVANQKF